ncbi:MAG: PAS domain-containing protein, partial [Chloroflexota bacterium]
MKKSKDTISDLRQNAEAQLSQRQIQTDPLPTAEDMARLLHELQVHQIELELLNEELVTAKIQLESEREKYTGLYDFAPAGYFSFDAMGIIQEVNLNGAALLGQDRPSIIRKLFTAFIGREMQDEFSLFLQKVFSSLEKCYCELIIYPEDGCPRYIQMEGSIPDGGDQCFA